MMMMMTGKNAELRQELNARSTELSAARREIERLKDQLEGSVEVGRLLKVQLDQAAVRENLLRQEVRQAVQDERTQMTGLTTQADQTSTCVYF